MTKVRHVLPLDCCQERHHVLIMEDGSFVFCDHRDRQFLAEAAAAAVARQDRAVGQNTFDCGALALMLRQRHDPELRLTQHTEDLTAFDSYQLALVYQGRLRDGRRLWWQRRRRAARERAATLRLDPNHPAFVTPGGGIRVDDAACAEIADRVAAAVAREVRRRGLRCNITAAGPNRRGRGAARRYRHTARLRPEPNPFRVALEIGPRPPGPYSALYYSTSSAIRDLCHKVPRIYAQTSISNAYPDDLVGPPLYFATGGDFCQFDVSAAADLFEWVVLDAPYSQRFFRVQYKSNTPLHERLLPAELRANLLGYGVSTELSVDLEQPSGRQRGRKLVARTRIVLGETAPGVLQYALAQLARALAQARRMPCLNTPLDPMDTQLRPVRVKLRP